MGFLIALVFGLNLLCALVPCELNFDPPEAFIRSNSEYYSIEGSLRNEYPVVFTKSGGLKGYSMGTIHGNRVHAFEGIPYGAPPIGQLRFRAPVPSKSWKGIRNAFKPSKRCLQVHPTHVFRVIGDEDCLYLNIYSPNVRDSEKKKKIPVVIWFHGGSFIFGGGAEYGPSYITDHNLILVTINYRLGVLGFMSTADLASPGNYGLKDQALALKWIHENIASFGGDPKKVTLMGQSAGAVSAHLHMVANNKTQDYFRSAVALSGTAFQNWAVQTPREALFWTNWLADLVHCPRTTKSSYALVECFRSQSPAKLVAYTMRLFKWFTFPPVLFAPVVEPYHPDVFLTETIENIYKRGQVARKPMIATIVSQEGYAPVYLLGLLQQMKYLRRNFDLFQSFVFDYDHLVNATEVIKINEELRNFYFGAESPETVDTSKIVEMITDRYFMNGVVRGLRAHAQVAPTYAYLFDFLGRTNVGKAAGFIRSEWGVGHGEDMFYFFNSSRYYDGMLRDTPDFQISQIMLRLLAGFVHTGVPRIGDSGNGGPIWEAVDAKKGIRFLYIGENQIQMVDNPFRERIHFWEGLGIPGADLTPIKNAL